jgi:hypothetical protein
LGQLPLVAIDVSFAERRVSRVSCGRCGTNCFADSSVLVAKGRCIRRTGIHKSITGAIREILSARYYLQLGYSPIAPSLLSSSGEGIESLMSIANAIRRKWDVEVCQPAFDPQVRFWQPEFNMGVLRLLKELSDQFFIFFQGSLGIACIQRVSRNLR